jgi:hypothetical protein
MVCDADGYPLNGVRCYPDMNISTADLDRSLLLRTDHNEWGLQNYRVCGILAVFPFEYWNHVPPGSPAYSTVPDILAEFAPLVVYSLLKGQRVSPTGPVTASDIYR